MQSFSKNLLNAFLKTIARPKGQEQQFPFPDRIKLRSKSDSAINIGERNQLLGNNSLMDVHRNPASLHLPLLLPRAALQFLSPRNGRASSKTHALSPGRLNMIQRWNKQTQMVERTENRLQPVKRSINPPLCHILTQQRAHTQHLLTNNQPTQK